MAFNTKALALGGIGCIVAAGWGLAQAKASLSVREKLAFEGYVLISSKEQIANEIWKNRASLYRGESNNSKVLLSDLDPKNVNESGKEIKEKCDSFTDGKVSFESVGDAIYEKIIKLCTLKIKEYIKSHFSEEDKFLTDGENDQEWEEKFEKNEVEIKKEIATATKEKAKTDLSKYCLEKYELNQSNKNKDYTYNIANWCVRKNIYDPELDENKKSFWEDIYGLI